MGAAMSRISINGITIDTHKNAAALMAANLISVDASGSNYILIQTNAPITKEDREKLTNIKVEILEYVPDDTYICRYEPSDLSEIRKLPFVTWVNTYLKEFKIAPGIRPDVAANALSFAPNSLQLSRAPVTVEVVLHKKSMTDAVRDEIAKAAGLDPGAVLASNGKIRLTVQQRRLDAVAAIDEVRHIERYEPPHLFNNVARGILAVDPAQANGMRGEGQIICVCDTGFDQGSPINTHPAFGGRVIKLYALGRGNEANDPDGHGTHVCGSALGDGVAINGTVIRGSAPAARLIVQSVLDAGGGLGGLPTDLHDLFLPPYRDDAVRIHTNSWGGPANSGYSANSAEVDDFVYNHRDFVICFAAGNAGSDAASTGVVALGSVGSPGTAKNSITVGASENNRPGFKMPQLPTPLEYGDGWPRDFPSPPIKTDPVSNNSEGMAAFSSRGPASNNRIRPDVVAPGTSILSTKSSVATSTGWAPYDALFFFDGGTSMATPLVAGCAAVTRQFLLGQSPASPSAALVKAMLINGADPMHGQYAPPEVGSAPDNNQGFGRVNLAATIGPYAAGTTVVFKDEATELDTGDVDTVEQALTAGQSLKVTLAWTDPAGESLQNDLDLVVLLPNGLELHGNMPAGSTNFDRSNNVEQVAASNAAAGNATITVKAYRCVSPQSYALVIRVS
jgi:serine protease AprX